MSPVSNLAASVRQRLLNRSRSDKRPFAELLQYYAMERFLFRLSKSGHADKFILKGALMLRVWQSPEFRSTMDIDLLGRTDNDEASIAAQVKEILAVEVEPDGLMFEPATIQFERISENADYQGIRVRFKATLDTARVNMQLDIGFGDIIHPKMEMAELPTILDSPPPRLLCYSRESAIAEKLEAMVKLGILNSRMKDFCDIWLLSRQFEFDGNDLAEAIRLTFRQRGTPIPAAIEALTPSFAEAKQVQWAAFRKRLQQDYIPEAFSVVTNDLGLFISPVVASILAGNAYLARWKRADSWACFLHRNSPTQFVESVFPKLIPAVDPNGQAVRRLGQDNSTYRIGLSGLDQDENKANCPIDILSMLRLLILHYQTP